MAKNRINPDEQDQNAQLEEDQLKEALVDQLKDLYSAEKQLVKALPKLAKAASSSALQTAFEEHLEETKEHVNRLEKIFEELEEKSGGKKCKGMEGLIEEGDETVTEKKEGPMKDIELIAAAQRVEHYEIAGYGVVRTFAEKLGLGQIAQTLQQTLDEEGEADKKLTAISENLINASL